MIARTIPYAVSERRLPSKAIEPGARDWRSHHTLYGRTRSNSIVGLVFCDELECMRWMCVRYTGKRGYPYMDAVGVDISKADFHACLLQGDKRARKSFPNVATGYRQFLRWLDNRKAVNVHVCMEATGAYWRGLAMALHEGAVTVSVINPSRTALFARSQLRRTKTDRVDAEMIAEFCLTQRPDSWQPPAKETLELRGLLTYRDLLVADRTALKQALAQIYASKDLQRLHTKQLKAIDQSICAIEAQIRSLLKRHAVIAAQVAALEAIEGIGFITAATIVAKLPANRLRSPKAAAAYTGLAPSERRSGTSIHGKARICKTGDSELRKALYMPALVASKHNPILHKFAQRLKERGKPAKVIIVAVMRKLIELAFVRLKATLVNA